MQSAETKQYEFIHDLKNYSRIFEGIPRLSSLLEHLATSTIVLGVSYKQYSASR